MHLSLRWLFAGCITGHPDRIVRRNDDETRRGTPLLGYLDVGGLNVSNRSTVQVGFVNVTERIEGVQLGFLNVASNGFLPVFPFFNFPKN